METEERIVLSVAPDGPRYSCCICGDRPSFQGTGRLQLPCDVRRPFMYIRCLKCLPEDVRLQVCAILAACGNVV